MREEPILADFGACVCVCVQQLPWQANFLWLVRCTGIISFRAALQLYSFRLLASAIGLLSSCWLSSRFSDSLSRSLYLSVSLLCTYVHQSNMVHVYVCVEICEQRKHVFDVFRCRNILVRMDVMCARSQFLAISTRSNQTVEQFVFLLKYDFVWIALAIHCMLGYLFRFCLHSSSHLAQSELFDSFVGSFRLTSHLISDAINITWVYWKFKQIVDRQKTHFPSTMYVTRQCVRVCQIFRYSKCSFCAFASKTVQNLIYIIRSNLFRFRCISRLFLHAIPYTMFASVCAQANALFMKNAHECNKFSLHT